MTVEPTALLLARLRAATVPTVDAYGVDLDAAAADVGRRVVRSPSGMRIAWADGHEPQPDGPSTSTIGDFAALVFVVVLALAWTDPGDDPWPGEPLPSDVVEIVARQLERDTKIVRKYLPALVLQGLLADDAGTLRLGEEVALWPSAMIRTLRRHHDVLDDVRRRALGLT